MNTTNLNTVTVEETSNQGLGPGGRLQAARIQKGMSIGDVASQMHLSSAILEALEENNFEEITAPIFVKGYLRAYARIVTIDEDAIINEYIELYSNEDPPITTTSNTVAEISSSDARIKWMTYLVVMVLIALLGTWWWSQQHASQQVISLGAEETTLPVPAVEAADSEQGEPFIEDESSGMTADEAGDSTAIEEAAIEPSPVEDEELPLLSLMPAAETPPAADDTRETGGSSESFAEATDGQGQGDAAETTVPPVPAPSVAVPGAVSTWQRQAPAGSDQLRMVVNADTWADIKDATGFQLAYDLVRAGNTVILTGSAPFNVFLGNGYGVDLEVNHQSLDITSFIRSDNTARFQTGS